MIIIQPECTFYLGRSQGEEENFSFILLGPGSRALQIKLTKDTFREKALLHRHKGASQKTMESPKGQIDPGFKYLSISVKGVLDHSKGGGEGEG